MPAPRVLVVGETPSLGRAIVDLLESDGIPCRYVLEVRNPEDERLDEIHLLVVASSGPYCATLRAEEQGLLNGQNLIIVGSRDPRAKPGPNVHLVPLPLKPAPLLQLIRSLTAKRTPSSEN